VSASVLGDRGGDKSVANLVPFSQQPDDPKAHAQADTARTRALFTWARGVLEKIGLTEAVRAAKSLFELRTVKLDLKDPQITLAAREALHPADGKRRQAHFIGLSQDALKRILENQLNDIKRDREKKLREARSATGLKTLFSPERARSPLRSTI
jgi:hypothetical protein